MASLGPIVINRDNIILGQSALSIQGLSEHFLFPQSEPSELPEIMFSSDYVSVCAANRSIRQLER